MGSVTASGGALKLLLAERLSDLDRQIADERARNAPNQARIRRMTRELALAKDRVAALGGCGMPLWARDDPR